ncbi:hypothetical protein [Mesorhizobium sp. 43Arga]
MRRYHRSAGIHFEISKPKLKWTFKYNLLIFGAAITISGCQSSNIANYDISARNSDLNAETKVVYDPQTTASWNPHIGTSAHICSPSGFGRQSRCFLRT